MPIYEYKCKDCGYEVDYFQSYKEEPKTECPTCDGKLQRMVTKGAGLVFKGSGFYITDYKKKETESSKAKVGEKHSSDTKNKKDSKPSESSDKTKKENSAESKMRKAV